MRLILILTIIFLPIKFAYSQQQFSNVNCSKSDSLQLKNHQGHWLCHSKSGFLIVDMEDLNNILIYEYFNNEEDTLMDSKNDKWFYKSKAQIKTCKENGFSLQTKKFLYIFIYKQDTLVTIDEMGEKEKLFRLIPH